MKIKIYLEKGASLPSTAHCNDFGYDVKATALKISGQIVFSLDELGQTKRGCGGFGSTGK